MSDDDWQTGYVAGTRDAWRTLDSYLRLSDRERAAADLEAGAMGALHSRPVPQQRRRPIPGKTDDVR